jgi:hypothetical protein
MSNHVVSASEDTPLAEIATLLERPLPQIATNAKALLPTASFRLDLLDRLAGEAWTSFGERNVIVRSGVVHLWGSVLHARWAQRVHEQVEAAMARRTPITWEFIWARNIFGGPLPAHPPREAAGQAQGKFPGASDVFPSPPAIRLFGSQVKPVRAYAWIACS